MDSDTEYQKTYKRVLNKDSNLRTEPKFIVFLTQLLHLFKFCSTCKSDDVLVNVVEVGTMAQVKVTCSNLKCGKKDTTWNSQPPMTGTSIPAGNLLLSFGILTSGTSATKVTRALKHMGLSCISLRTYFLHQREKLYPALLIYWREYQAKIMEELKACQNSLTIAGDGRHDSMGHSAKYCAYTTFCCTVPKIIDFSLVQRNEVGNSTGMEFEGFQRSMDFLESQNIPISTLITDRHSKIAKHMREKRPNITHYFDLWHLTKKVTKVLAKIAKYAGCESILEWIKPCCNHLYWSATTTLSGNGKVIVAKFKSFLGHVKNKHSGFSDPLFDKYSVAYNKMYGLNQAQVVAGIMKASPLSQTSSLEGFHSVVNQFSPKMISYSFPGMFCRHVLAVVHFNSNLDRENCEKNGTTQVKVHYPKFKNGEAVVRNVKVAQNFEYIEDIYQVMLSAIQEDKLDKARNDIKQMTPLPMNTMLEKQSKVDAILKKARRQSMTTLNVPPTNPVEEVVTTPENSRPKKRAKPRCSLCKNHMDGHKNVTNCPRNKTQSNST
ncbi:uncharacterized protein LOC114539599 [Dendronephthya gigantea]|uniref:uncharacterized protein LOC114539599 n=1 Tax=Dendronephthya gigantea TaxID=151771 RepID=UPI001068FF93|nr:uncharacterized protein LOC114539599 [Dendronephthya gigantea]